MKPIDFSKECPKNQKAEEICEETVHPAGTTAVPSVVRIKFRSFNRELDYFNDKFDLKIGDLVFVDGKLAGQRGCVTAVSKHFKIKAEDYKQVIGLADTRISGQFLNAGSHLVTFDRSALSYRQFRTWVLPPMDDDTEYFVSFDEEGVALDNLNTWCFNSDIMKRGIDYYQDNHVLFISLDRDRGRAIVDGTRPYEVEFNYDNGLISGLSCDCPCGYHCKHEAAALLQLRDTLGIIEKRYAADWKRADYFAAVLTPVFFSIAVDGNSKMILSLEQSDR